MGMTFEEEVFGRYAGKSILLDSGLLLLYISGSVDLRLLDRFKRVRQYTIPDFELLEQLLRSFRILVTTPHVLTEVSNLANALPERFKYEWFKNLATLIASESKNIGIREHWTPAKELANTPEFMAFGITDTALTKLAPDALVVTADHRLSGALRAKGIPVLNFGDLRRLQALANG